MAASLFGEDESRALEMGRAEAEREAATPLSVGRPRLRLPQRDQVELNWCSLDQLLVAEHPARLVWRAVGHLNLSRWLVHIKAVEHTPGRSQTDPRLLVSLWVFATLEGISSAREVARLCENHIAYRWLCGGVSVNHHLLSDFRTDNAAAWSELLSQIVAALLSSGEVTMNCVAQDGMRVRANAGSDTFRRRPTLQKFLEQARAQVAALSAAANDDDDDAQTSSSSRVRAACERAARDKEERVQQALEELEKLQSERDERSKRGGTPPQEARASTTDPEARVMKMADGGYRPAYNVQFATDVESRLIVGVDVVQDGSDFEQLPPMLEQLQTTYGQTPATALVDCGFASRDGIEQATALGCTVYAPLRNEAKQLAAGKNPYAKKRDDTPALAAWRERMGTAAAQAIYKLRCQTAEWVNAMARNRGLQQMPVRGLAKCKTIGVLFAIVHNLVIGEKLRAEATMST